MTIEEKVRSIVRKAIDNFLAGNDEASDKAAQAILELINEGEPGVIKADEVTLGFFRKYLEMPDGTLEDLCREIIRLKKIKPMSREELSDIILKQMFSCKEHTAYDITDAILAEWRKK